MIRNRHARQRHFAGQPGPFQAADRVATTAVPGFRGATTPRRACLPRSRRKRAARRVRDERGERALRDPLAGDSQGAGIPVACAGAAPLLVIGGSAFPFRIQLVVRVVQGRRCHCARTCDLDADAAIVRRRVGVDLARGTSEQPVPGIVANVVARDHREGAGGDATDVVSRQITNVRVDPVADERSVIAHQDAAAVPTDDVVLQDDIVERLDPVPRVPRGGAVLVIEVPSSN